MRITVGELKKLVSEASKRITPVPEDEVWSTDEEAQDLSDEQVNAVMKVPFLAKYLGEEIEFAGSVRNAICNSLAVYQESGKTHLSDQDGYMFNYVWDEKSKRWKSSRRK